MFLLDSCSVSCLMTKMNPTVGLQFQVWREFSQETGHCLTSRLRLVNSDSRRSRSIWHLQYCAWGDHGCPSSPAHFLGK